MKAWVSHSAGGPETLLFEERPMPVPLGGELLVRIEAVGVNFADGLLIRDLYQVKPPRPFVPGSEFCGIVEETATDVTQFQRGDVVIGRCGWGALSEYVTLPQDRCVRIPASLPRTEAAAFQFAYATAYHALRDAGRLKAGETLVVLGAAGGVGSAAVDIGRALGANVIAVASTQAKLAFATVRGVVGGLVCDAALEVGDGQNTFAAQLKELVPGGADVIFDPVGGAHTEPALRSLNRGGRHLVVGFAAGIPRVPLNLVLLKGSHIVGVDWRTFVRESPQSAWNLKALLCMWQHGFIAPRVTERYSLSAAPEAIARLESRNALGKIAVAMPTA